MAKQFDFKALPAPKAQSCRVIDFEKAVVIDIGTHRFLVVAGLAPCLNMDVSLQALVYIQCPTYWGIEVVGCLPGEICLDAVKPFVVWIDLAGIVGSQGIEVIGATKTEKIALRGGCS